MSPVKKLGGQKIGIFETPRHVCIQKKFVTLSKMPYFFLFCI